MSNGKIVLRTRVWFFCIENKEGKTYRITLPREGKFEFEIGDGPTENDPKRELISSYSIEDPERFFGGLPGERVRLDRLAKATLKRRGTLCFRFYRNEKPGKPSYECFFRRGGVSYAGLLRSMVGDLTR